MRSVDLIARLKDDPMPNADDPPGPIGPLELGSLREPEERRRLAELFVLFHKFLSLVDEHRGDLLPGELQDGFHDHWTVASRRLHALTNAVLTNQPGSVPGSEGQEEPPDFGALVRRELTGRAGAIKRGFFASLYDTFRRELGNLLSRGRSHLLSTLKVGVRAGDFAAAICGSLDRSWLGETFAIAKTGMEVVSDVVEGRDRPSAATPV
jgi:hypothetical protein